MFIVASSTGKGGIICIFLIYIYNSCVISCYEDRFLVLKIHERKFLSTYLYLAKYLKSHVNTLYHFQLQRSSILFTTYNAVDIVLNLKSKNNKCFVKKCDCRTIYL